MLPSFQEMRSHLRSLIYIPAWDTPRTGFVPLNGVAGALVPPELFSQILHFVSQRDEALYERIRRPRDFSHDEVQYALSNAFPQQTLKNCALVCRYWANQSRAYMFTDARITIRSLEDAELFRKYAIDGSRHLNRVCELCGSLQIEQEYSRSRRSFLDLVYLPQTRSKLKALKLVGPRLEDMGNPPFVLDTPYWGLPNVSAVSPSLLTSYEQVTMNRMEFPSIFHVFKYVKHFRVGAVTIEFDSLTWDGKEDDPLRPRATVSSSKRSSKATSCRASNCSDNFLICWQMVMVRADFALWTVPEPDQQWAMRLSRTIYDSYINVLGSESSTANVHVELTEGELTSTAKRHAPTC